MKIELTKEQYKNLIILVEIGGWPLGILSDAIEDGEDYEKRNDKAEELQNYLLKYAEDFGCKDLVGEFDGKRYLKEKIIDGDVYPVIEDYVDFEMQDGLANELAIRDFRQEHSEAEIKKMGKENGGYFGVALYDYEKKYWEEFENYGYDRLEVKK